MCEPRKKRVYMTGAADASVIINSILYVIMPSEPAIIEMMVNLAMRFGDYRGICMLQHQYLQ